MLITFWCLGTENNRVPQDFLGAADKFVHGRFYHQCQPKEPVTTLNVKNNSVHIRSESCWRNTESKNC